MERKVISIVAVVVVMVVASVVGSGETQAGTLYVGGTGSYATIQAAINAASDDDFILVADGPYPENLVIECKSLFILGGWNNDFSERDWVANITTIDGGGAASCVRYTDTPNGELSGFTMTNGYAYGGTWEQACGGGIFCLRSSPRISHNIITGNTAASAGGGIHCKTSSPTITDNTIADNTASGTASGDGGGIWCAYSSFPTITRNKITANTSGGSGGGIYVNASSPVITNNTITGNTSTRSGGGIQTMDSAGPTITNNTITGNTSGEGGGIHRCTGASPTIRNCILWDNGDDLAGCSATYSCIQDGDAGDGNISSDPDFADPEYHLAAGSPCIDAGDPAYSPGPGEVDLDGNPRVVDGDCDCVATVDMGAYERAPSPGTWYVREGSTGSGSLENPFGTIRAAINSACDGNTIQVAGGLYPENLVIDSKSLIILGGWNAAFTERDWDIHDTTIDGNQIASCIRYTSSPGGELSGFTITNGHAKGGGPDSHGGGIYCGGGSSPTIANNKITRNTAGHMGGGVASQYGSSLTLINCLVSGNNVTDTGGGGGAGTHCNDSAMTVINCTITGNRSTWGGGAYYSNFASVTVINTIMWGNEAEPSNGTQIAVTNQSSLDVSYSDVEGGESAAHVELNCTLNWGPDNIGDGPDDDPDFVSPSHWDDNGTPGDTSDDTWVEGNCRLTCSSCCIDAGTNDAPDLPPTDLDGNDRIVDGDCDGSEIVDMGAYEFQGTTPPEIICPSDINDLECPGDTHPDNTGYATATGGCPPVVVSWSDETVQGCGNTKTITRTWTATDECGNPSSPCVQTITVVDTTPPTCYAGPVDPERVEPDGDNDITLTCSTADACDPEPDCEWYEGATLLGVGCTLVYDFPRCRHTVTLRCTDDCGNVSEDTVVVTIYDVLHVDDNAPSDPGPGDPLNSDPLEDGSSLHPYDSIQEAIDAACDGDAVIVLDGTYTGDGNRDLNFGGREITVRSENGPTTCIINAEGTDIDPHRGFIFQSGEGADSIVEGFTIKNGYAANGGGIACENSSSPTISHNIITGNTATDGGGIACHDNSAPAITNNTITSNTGGGVYCDSSSPVITNSIVWGNGGGITGGSPTATYCDVEGGYPGLCNIDADPLFADAANGDYHPKSAFGRWHSGIGMFVIDDATSPCIDGGESEEDEDRENETAPYGCAINIGAYGNTVEASRRRVDGDLTGDGRVTVLDMIHVRNHLNASCHDCDCD